MSFISHQDGKQLATQRKKARTAVAAGRARWLHERPKVVEVRPLSGPPVKHERRPFGFGLLRAVPSYRSPVSLSDMAWWEEQNALEEERDLARRFAEFEAMDRMSRGLDV